MGIDPEGLHKGGTPSGVGGETVQVDVVPPLLPVHCQVHGPVPVTAEAVPAVQRPALGATLAVVPFAGPHAPFSGVVPAGTPGVDGERICATADV